MKMFLLMNLILLCFFHTACGFEESKLPKEMPKNLEISFNANYGMSPAYQKILIDIDEILFDAKDYAADKKTFETNKWKAKVDRLDLAKLYQVFVENKFDTITNDKQKGITYDAPSEGIFISLNEKDYFQISYGDNHPMSGNNLRRYEAVKKAIFDLAAKYAAQKQVDLSDEKQQIFAYDSEKFRWIIKDAQPANLEKDDIALIEDLLPKAIEDYNAKQKYDFRKIKDFLRYKRQIISYLNSKGEKEVWINCFCEDYGQNWRKTIIAVDDGGKCYFNLKINLITKTVFDFSVNGEA